MKRPYGAMVVMATPFNASGSLDEKGYRANIDWYIANGIHGVICTGSTSEFASLSRDELKKAIEVTVDQVAGRVPVMAGTAAVTTRDTLEMTRFAAKAGVDTALIVGPYYGGPNQEELALHFVTVAEGAGLPIMLYNNPGLSGVDLLPETVAAIAEQCDNVTFIKETSGDFKRVHEIQNLTRGTVEVWCGWEDLALEFLLMGAGGWVAPTANFAPTLCARLFEQVRGGQLAEARKTYDTLLPLLQFLEEGRFLAKCKAALDLLGLAGGKPRLPFLPVDDEARQRLAGLMRAAGLLG